MWADGSSSSKVIARSKPRVRGGCRAVRPRHPEADVTTVLRTLSQVSSPALLTGRSCGGSVLTAWPGSSIFPPLAPDTDETSQSQ